MAKKKQPYPKWKRYLWSAGQTFIAAFLAALSPQIMELTWGGLEWSAVAAIMVTAFKVGIKAAVESFTMRK